MLIDTGTTINIIDSVTFSRIKGVDLKQTKVQAYAYNSNTPMQMQGKFKALVETKQRYAVATFYVTKDNGGCLLSYSTAKDLSVVQRETMQIGARERGMQIGAAMQIGAQREAT